jgi:hypothetical protein
MVDDSEYERGKHGKCDQSGRCDHPARPQQPASDNWQQNNHYDYECGLGAADARKGCRAAPFQYHEPLAL